jgi:hypothetical protein
MSYTLEKYMQESACNIYMVGLGAACQHCQLMRSIKTQRDAPQIMLIT